MEDVNRTDFILERYKFVLQEIHFLNENLYKYLAVFQTLSTAIVGGGVILFVSWKDLGISAEIARVSIRGLLGMLIILTMFVIISIIIGIVSWFDYRREEFELMNEVFSSTTFRKPPNVSNFWRWHETYLLIFIIVVVIFITVLVETQILPIIQ